MYYAFPEVCADLYIQNPVNALSVADIKRIYKGKVKNWLLLGGNLTPIRAYQYFYHSPEQAWLLGFMEGSPLIPAISERIVPSMSYYRQTCLYKNDKGGLGFGYRNNLIDGINANEIKLLSIGTEEPSRENIVYGAYPLVQAIYAVTVSRKPVTEESRLRQENTEYLIEWLLSDQGQSLVEAAVYARMK